MRVHLSSAGVELALTDHGAGTPEGPPATVVIGNFDGVHRGHQALLAHARHLADAEAGQVIALTFDPHPQRFFAPTAAPPLLTTRAQQLALLAQQGVDVTVIEPFDEPFAALTPQAFAQRLLVAALRARHVVVGATFRFGHGRAGTVATLRTLGDALGFATHGVEPEQQGNTVISSTRVRELVLEGRVADAAELLGRPYALTGVVEHGAGRGTTIGVPTANLRVSNELLPAAGVYAAIATLPGAALPEQGQRAAVVNVGHAPTFGRDGAPVVEAHLLDFVGALHGQPLELAFVERLRAERRFPSAEALVTAIRRDIALARRCLPDSTAAPSG